MAMGLQSKLMLELAEREKSVFSIEDAKKILQTSDSTTRHVLLNLVKKRRLQRIERGKYLWVPEIAGKDLYWSESPWVIIPHLIDEYYVGFLTAMNYWDMTEQIPYTIFIVTPKRKRNLEFGGQRFEFVTLSRKKFFGSVKEKAGKKGFFHISSPEKTIVDGLTHPEYCGGIVEVTKAIWNSKEILKWDRLLDIVKKVDIDVVAKRLKYLSSVLEIHNEILDELNIKNNSYHYLDPRSAKISLGASTSYGLIINISNADLISWRGH